MRPELAMAARADTVSVTFVGAGGDRTEAEAEVGLSLMKAALFAGVGGIEADCGGACTCATCHVYIAEEWFARLAPCDEMEEATLEFAVDQRPTSRLSCQIELTPELDGLVVQVPASQF